MKGWSLRYDSPPPVLLFVFILTKVNRRFQLEKKSVNHFRVVVYTAGMKCCHHHKTGAFILVFKWSLFPPNRKQRKNYLVLTYMVNWCKSADASFSLCRSDQLVTCWVNSLARSVIFKGFVHKVSKISRALLRSHFHQVQLILFKLKVFRKNV